MENPEFCPRCRLLGPAHETESECITAQQEAMIKQKKSSESLALALATNFFAVLESLVADPDCGIPYTTRDPETGKVKVLHSSQVQGVMSAIFLKYQSQGDWSPWNELKEELRQEQLLNKRFKGLLEECLDRFDILPKEFIDRAMRLLHPEGEE